MIIQFESEIKIRFPDLIALILQINNLTIRKKDDDLEKFKLQIINLVKNKYCLDTVKDHSTFRAYRNFYWKIKIDPTKNRPAAEALTRRILAGQEIPRINTLVDAYNLASINSGIALATFDTDVLNGNLFMRFAEEGEKFLGIGMKKPFVLKGGEIVVSDEEKLIAIYPYRDSDTTKITEKTKNVTIVICGVPGLQKKALISASNLAEKYVLRFCS